MRSSRWLMIALIGSMGINLALIGFTVGRATSGELRPEMLNPMPGFARLLHELPAERREALRPQLREHFAGMRSSVRGIRKAQEELGRAIVAEPFDPDRLARALDAVRDHLLTSQANSNAAFVSLVTELTPAERQQLLKRLSSRGPGGEPGRHPHRPMQLPPGDAAGDQPPPRPPPPESW